MNKVKVGGTSDLLRGIQTAQLALMHRQNKNLKKNNVSLDLVSFGEVDENQTKLDKLLGAVNSGDTSHVLPVPVGPKLLSDVLLSSPIIAAEGEIPAAAMGGGGADAGFEFGIDP